MNSIEQQPVKTLEEALETLSSTPPGVETLQPVASAGNVETGATPVHSVYTEDPLVVEDTKPWALEVNKDNSRNVTWTGSGYTLDGEGNKTSGDGAAEIVERKRNGEPPL